MVFLVIGVILSMVAEVTPDQRERERESKEAIITYGMKNGANQFKKVVGG